MSRAPALEAPSPWLSMGLGGLALSCHVFATTLAAVTLSRGVAATVVAFVTFTSLTAWLARLPRDRRLRAACVFALVLAALDLTLALRIAYGTPWRSPPWIASQVVALALASVASWRLAPPARLARASVAMGVAVVSVVAFVGALYLVEVLNCLRQTRGDAARRVDTAVVLGFGLLEGGTPSPVFVARIARGVALHRAGLCARVLFTGGVGTHGPAESVAAVAVARAMGLPEEATLLEDRSHTTRENMIEAARVLRAQGLPLGPVAIVSDTFHLARSRRLARDAGLDPVMVAAITPAWTAPRRATWWVLRESALLVLDDGLRLVGRR